MSASSVIEHRVRGRLSGDIEPMPLELGVHHRIVVERPTLWRPSTCPLVAAPKSGVLVPGPWNHFAHPFPAILTAIHHARTLSSGTLLLVGHDEAGGKPELGKQRADGLLTILKDDGARWVAIATATASLLDVQAYIQYLDRERGWACGIQAVDGVDDERSAAAVEGFQREYNLRLHAAIHEDGVCGEETLGAVHRVLRFEWVRWAEKHGLSQSDIDAIEIRTLTARAGHVLHPGKDGAPGAPALDILVASSEALAELGASADPIYESGLPRWAALRVVPEPGAWEYGVYTLVTDVALGEVMLREVYVLSSTDGQWEDRQVLPDDAIDTGLLELRFESVPTDKAFDLRVEIEGVGVSQLFSALTYPQLHLNAIGALPTGEEG